MSAYKIFISSPGDGGRERHLAEQVIRRVAVEFQNRVEGAKSIGSNYNLEHCR